MRRIWDDDLGKHVARGTPARGLPMLMANFHEALNWWWLFEGIKLASSQDQHTAPAHQSSVGP
jgi:hypothetical protein